MPGPARRENVGQVAAEDGPELVTQARDALEAGSIPVHLRPINNHDHNYYRRSGEINVEAWAFLKKHKLDRAPKFKEYATR